MTISIIGTNGLLADEMGLFCNSNNIDVISYGLAEPKAYQLEKYHKINLLENKIDYSKLIRSDLIVYASGAGIQSNLNESSELIYGLNTYAPITICKELDAVDYRGVFITFGSYFEIGSNSDDHQFTEFEVGSSMLDVPNDYCISKRLLTRFVNSYNPPFKHFHLILPTIYGQRESTHRLIPYTVSAIKNKESVQFTDGQQVRQYLYVGDVPEILMSLAMQETGGIYNLSGIETYTVREVVELVYGFYGLNPSENFFGKTERADAGMKNLQLNGSKLFGLLPNIKYTRLSEAFKLYDCEYRPAK